MRKKILKSMTAFIATSILLTFALLLGLMYRQESVRMKESVRNEAGYISLAIERAGESYLDKAVGGVTSSRITLVAEDGEILYDSAADAEALENHKDRPELKDAWEKGEGEAVRLSRTLGETTYYFARLLDNGQVIRVARVTDSVFAVILDSLLPLGLVFIVLAIPAVLLARRQTERLVEPVNRLNLENPLENDVYEELAPLLHRINKQNLQISAQMKELKSREEEYHAITENMKDGLVVTNRSVILSINRAAANLFHLAKEECVRQNILVLGRNLKLKECLEKALDGDSNHMTLRINDRSYQALGSPVRVEGIVQGAVLFLLDMTEKEEVERMRREFSANVSHELKTPLMSIMGYAELLCSSMAKPQDTEEFSRRIFHEAKRLSALVTDIMNLSRLDEGQVENLKERVELMPLAMDVREHLAWQVKAAQVDFSLEGEPVTVFGNSGVLYEILFNLCENAVKYNRPEGRVILRLKQKGDQVEILVRDTGIGIPKEDKERIYERFYRVDKSRSRQEGGTGLGLSIVKHGVLLHHGEIRTESRPGEGTAITVLLPGAIKQVH